MDILIHNRYVSDMRKMFINFKHTLLSMYPEYVTVHDEAKVIEIKGADLVLRFVSGSRVIYIIPPLYIYSDSVESRYYINRIVKDNEDPIVVGNLYSEEEILDTIVSRILLYLRGDRDVNVVSKLYYIAKRHNYRLHISRTSVSPNSFGWIYSIKVSIENLRNGEVYEWGIPIGADTDYDKDFFESFEKSVIKELERI